MANRKINVAIVGLGFGARFIPIYQQHPQTQLLAICQRSRDRLQQLGDGFAIERRYSDYQQLLADPNVDCVHINSPIDDHGWMTLAALKAGKHVLCAVPMATTIEQCEQICQLVKQTGLKYMMAETAIYNREFLYVSELYRNGELGDIQYLQASHPQDMAGWPDYWRQMAPMHYATHAVGSVLSLIQRRAEYVSCFGSGRVRESIGQCSDNQYAVESCHIKIQHSDVAAHIWRCLFDTARQYRESLNVYGVKQSFEWSLIEGDGHVLHSAKPNEAEIPSKIKVPDYAHRLPEAIQALTRPPVNDLSPLVKTGGSGGSHPHLVHEFVQAIATDSDPHPNALTSANWTCTGLCAHESSRNGGRIRHLPLFTLE